MAKMVLKAAFLSIQSNSLQTWLSKAELTTEVDEKDVTTFASLGWKEVLGGLASGTLAASFKQDVAAGALDDIMWPMFGLVVPFVARVSDAAVGASNPNWTGDVLIKQWTPISGSPGDVAELSVSWPTSGQVSRATT